jgi:hypothetical protein
MRSRAGLLRPLFAEMANTDDMLACLATLQQVTELVTLHTMSSTVAEQVLPQLLQLLHPRQDAALLSAALQASARIVPTVRADLAEAFIQKIEGVLTVRCQHDA